MEEVRIFVRYGGVWDANEGRYLGGLLKGTIVSKRITYNDLLAELYDIARVEQSKFDLTCVYHVNLGNDLAEVEVSSDRDVRFYLTTDNVLHHPLCLSFHPKNFEVHNDVPNALGEDNEESRRWTAYDNTRWDSSNRDNSTSDNSARENSNWDNSARDNSDRDNNPWDSSGWPNSAPSSRGWDNSASDNSAWPNSGPSNSGWDNSGWDNSAWDNSASDNSAWDNSARPTSTPEHVEVNNLTSGPDDIDGERGTPIEPGEGTGSRRKQGTNVSWPEDCSTSDGLDVGQIFSSKMELSMKLNVMAMKKNFEFRVKKSTRSIFYVKCVDDNCKWKLRAVNLKGSDLFMISKCANVHSCSLEILNHDHRQAKAWVVGDIIKSKFKEAGRQYKPRDIIQDMRQEYGINLSYEKAWRSRENAYMRVRGSPEESYSILGRYGEALKLANPGTIYDIELEEGCYFKYLFMALGPCIRGFLNCIRPVIATDGTFLKSKYRGTLIIATCLDGNNQIYPLAFGIVDRETDSSMKWFFEKLRGAIGEHEDLVFVSDRNSSIAKGIASVFPNAFHCLCVQHLRQNLNSKFKNDAIDFLFYTASRAYRESEFHQAWGRIQASGNGVGRYLEEVGLSRWARTQCPKKRYNLMTTNIAECMNGVLKDARELPVATLLEHIRSLLQRWFSERREEAANVTSALTKWAEGIVHESQEESLRLKVDHIDCYQCHVKDVDTEEIVNLNTMVCTCNKFQLDQLPCAHAIAAARDRSINLYNLCSPYYTNECLLAAYAEAIFPVGNATEWKTSDDYVNVDVLPPKVVARVGRRRRARIPSVGEEPRLLRCGRCNEIGHNRLTCTNPIAYTDK